MATHQEKVASAREVENEEIPEPPKDLSNTELGAQVDDLLDEIDDLLEENAEQFVAAFVQQGGE